MSELPEFVAVAGVGVLPGMVWRAGDPLKHLGPAGHHIPLWSQLFSTRCGLEASDGPWQVVSEQENDDVWCPACLAQGGVPHRVESLLDPAPLPSPEAP